MLDQLTQLIADWGVIAFSLVGFILLMLGIRLLIRLWPVLSRTVEIGNTLLELPETLGGLKKDLVIIKHEVENNDGSSLKDSVDEIHITLAEHTAKLALHSSQLDELASMARAG